MTLRTRAQVYRALARRAHPVHTRPATVAQLAVELRRPNGDVQRDLRHLRADGLVAERDTGWVAGARLQDGGSLHTYEELASPRPSTRQNTRAELVAKARAARLVNALQERETFLRRVENNLTERGPEHVVRCEGVTAAAIAARLRRAGRYDLAGEFRQLANADHRSWRKANPL